MDERRLGEEEVRPPPWRSDEAADARKTSYRAKDLQTKRAAEDYLEEIDETFGPKSEDWQSLVEKGNALLDAAGSVEEAAKALWEVREEKGMANLRGVDRAELDELLHPDLLGYLREVRKLGMPARYVGERTRVRSKLHPDAKKNVNQVYKQVAKDIRKGRILVAGANHHVLEHVVASPFETVQRLAHDQRGINAGTSKFLHPPAVQPSHAQIARRIMWWKTRCPGIPILLSKKDIAGAFKLLWVDPADVGRGRKKDHARRE